jgi:hypothetical protein
MESNLGTAGLRALGQSHKPARENSNAIADATRTASAWRQVDVSAAGYAAVAGPVPLPLGRRLGLLYASTR